MARSRLLILLAGCFLLASAAWADDVGYVDCTAHPDATQVFSKARQTPDVVATVACGERFTVLVYGFVFSRVTTRDGKIGYIYSSVITIDHSPNAAAQASARSSAAPAPAPAAAPSAPAAAAPGAPVSQPAAQPSPAAQAAPAPVTTQAAPTQSTPAPAAPVQPGSAFPTPPPMQVTPSDSASGPARPAPSPATPAAAPAPSTNAPAAADPAQPAAPSAADSQPTAAPQPSAPAQPGPLFPTPPPTPAAPDAQPATAAEQPQPTPTASASQPQPEAAQPEAAQPAEAPVREANARSTWERPVPGGRRQTYLLDLYSGYSFARFVSGGASTNLNGAMGSFGYNLKPWLQIVGDTSYNFVTVSGAKSVIFGNHFGPRYYYRNHFRWNVTPFVEGLVGGSRLDVTVSGAKTSQNCISYKAGGGIDVRVGQRWEVRLINVDYYRTSFGAGGYSASQNNYWASAGVVLRLFGTPGE